MRDWLGNCGMKLMFPVQPAICGIVIMVEMFVLGVIWPCWFVRPAESLMLEGVIVDLWRDWFDLGLAVFSSTAGPSA